MNKIIDSTVSEISINLTHAKMKRRRAGFVFFGFFSVKLLVVISNGRWRCFRLTFFFFFIASFSANGPFHQFVLFSNLHRMEAASNWQWRDQGNVESPIENFA